ncbi:MAG: DUF4410 domain-containing protein [Candidatus Acidiferrales bacterium]
MPDRQPDRQQGGPPPLDSSAGPESAPSPDTPERLKVIYVSDFELDAIPAPAGSAPAAKDAAAQARRIVKGVSENLLKDFAKAGYTTKLLHAGDPRPDDGFLIVGVFTQVDAENRVRRAVIGPGQNSAPIELYVAANDLARFPRALYKADSPEASGKQPGAVIEVNPEADAAKFSMQADATDKTLKQTAQRISNELVKRINAAKSEDELLNRYAKP